MPVYRGSAIKNFLIDRAALGLNNDAISSEFEATTGMKLTSEEIDEILKYAEDDIKQRESELQEELSSTNFIRMLYEVKDSLNTVRKAAKEEGDYKTYAQLTSTLLHSVDMLIGVSENFKKKIDVKAITMVQNNFFVLETLEKDGIIKIQDKDKLKAIWGFKEPGGKADG